jgi:hypothetical protein
MGPVIICDKSTLQALSRDELNALRRYYSLNIPPVLLVEILGDRDELKADLGHLARWWAGLSAEQQAEEGRVSGPPENDGSVTHRLWKKLRMWRSCAPCRVSRC